MNFEYAHLLPADFDDNAKVWVYQCNRLFGLSEALALETLLNDFVSNWDSHGATVKGYANLFFGQFIVFMADDTEAKICGRSIDAVARLVQEIEQQFSVQLMDRQLLAFVVKEKVQVLPLSQLKYAIDNQFIAADTLYFNNLVTDKKSLVDNWIIPVQQSWLASKLASLQNV